MKEQRIELTTQDGVCPAYTYQPDGAGPFSALLFYMDGVGIRPALFDMARRLAGAGYYVLLPDTFYRAGPYAPMNPATVFGDPAQRAVLMQKFMSGASIANVMKDTQAFLAHLAGQPQVRQPKVATTGYCMGGRHSIAAAGHYPDRIVAAAAFHPANLATDAADSPHLLAPRIKGELYIAGATGDQNFSDEQKARLEAALSAAGVKHQVETYPAKHGWVPSDTPVHDPAQAERHWKNLFALLERNLKS